MDSQRRTITIQIIIISAVCIALAVLAIIYLPRLKPAEQHKMTLRVESSAGNATIQYDAGNFSQTDPAKTFSTPWEKSWILKRGTRITLTAGNPQQAGTLTCILKLDNKNWKSESVKMPTDKVACAGIVP